jgi:hypothetical protein
MTAGIFDGYKRVFDDVMDERARQEALHPGDTCWELGKPDREKWAVFASEVQEVWDALFNNEPRANLRAELIQVAAVAVAWVQALDRLDAYDKEVMAR